MQPPEPERVEEYYLLRKGRSLGFSVLEVLEDLAGFPPSGMELTWRASGFVDGVELSVDHPTREGAVALWKERWTRGDCLLRSAKERARCR